MISSSMFLLVSVLMFLVSKRITMSWSPPRTHQRWSSHEININNNNDNNFVSRRKHENNILSLSFTTSTFPTKLFLGNVHNGNNNKNNHYHLKQGRKMAMVMMAATSTASLQSQNDNPPKKRLNSVQSNSSENNNTISTTEESSSSSSRSNSPFFKVSHRQVLETIEKIQQKDRNGETISQEECDGILALCVASDEWDSVLEVLDIYKRQNLTQARSSYRACLQACFKAGNGVSAKEILNAMEKALIEPEPSDIAITVGAMCRNNVEQEGHWRKALALLKNAGATIQSPEKTIPVHAYDTVMECIKEANEWKEAVRLLRLMEAGSSSSSSSAGRKNGTEVTEYGMHPAPELSTYRAAIECCVAMDQPEQAVQLLYSMKDRGIQPSPYTFELIISALSKRLQWRRALQLLETMEKMQIPKSVVTYNSVISACARAREVGMAKSLLAKMRKEGIRPDEVSFNSLIGACASSARWKDALDLLDQCYREPGVTPNIYIYTNAMRACAKGRQTQRALSLLQVVKDKGLNPDCYCYTAVIDACAKSGMWKKALALLREMESKGIEPTEVTYSVVISACGNGGQWKKALELLGLMQEKNMSINLITYNAAITALSKAARKNVQTETSPDNPKKFGDSSPVEEEEELWFKALELLKQMKKDGIEPDGFCYSSAISCLGAQGRWKEALDLIELMKKGGPRTRPNKIAYTAAISACGRAGEAKHALDLFQSMKDEGLSADRIAYNALFSALRVAGDAKRTFELWEEICGTRPTSTAAIATAKHVASPDIITVTDCITTLVRAERMKEVDQVFREAVDLGIVMRGNDLDSQWETDLSGMSFPVARAACRYILHKCLEFKSQEDINDVTFITGVGRAKQRQKEAEKVASPSFSKASSLSNKDPATSLREYVQEILETDFNPSLKTFIPRMAPGTVVAAKESIIEWSKYQ